MGLWTTRSSRTCWRPLDCGKRCSSSLTETAAELWRKMKLTPPSAVLVSVNAHRPVGVAFSQSHPVSGCGLSICSYLVSVGVFSLLSCQCGWVWFFLTPPTLPPGYDISTKAMSILFNRFAKKRSYMGLDDFCSCLSRVKIMNGERLHDYDCCC